MQNTMLRKRH